jgi:hypothetical protein
LHNRWAVRRLDGYEIVFNEYVRMSASNSTANTNASDAGIGVLRTTGYNKLTVVPLLRVAAWISPALLWPKRPYKRVALESRLDDPEVIHRSRLGLGTQEDAAVRAIEPREVDVGLLRLQEDMHGQGVRDDAALAMLAWEEQELTGIVPVLQEAADWRVQRVG